MRSLAVDRAFIALGVPIYISTTDPVDGKPIRRLVMAQDTGGAIKGPVRGDIFFGWGKDAEERLKAINERLPREKALAAYTLLIPKSKLDDILKKRADLLAKKEEKKK